MVTRARYLGKTPINSDGYPAGWFEDFEPVTIPEPNSEPERRKRKRSRKLRKRNTKSTQSQNKES